MKLVLSDALGNEVTVEGASLDAAARVAKRLFDHIRTSSPSAGPGAGGQTVGFRYTDPRWSDLRDGGHLEVTA